MSAAAPPPRIPGYRIVRRMDHGSMGTLWEAHDRQGRHVAVKVADRGGRVEPERLRRHYRREAAAVLNLDHPNLLRGFEAGTTEEGFPFLALEYVAGESLATRLLRDGPLEETAAVGIGWNVACALEHLHARGLVHRDVKPANVMLTSDGSAKLVDLGLAEVSDLGAPGCGTPGFASPEMMLRGSVGPRSDLWALGVTLATAVSGRCPFPGDETKEVLRNSLRMPLVLPDSAGGKPLSDGFRAVVDRLTRKAASERYASASEVRLDLEALREGDVPIGALLAARPPRARTRLRAIAIGVGSLTALAVGYALLTSHGAPPEPLRTAPNDAPRPPAVARADDADLETEAALLDAAREPDDLAGVGRRLEAVRARPMSPSQRARFDAAVASLAERRSEAARRQLARVTEEARRLRSTGDLEGMRRALADWPEALRDAPEASEAASLGRQWTEEALAPALALVEEARRSLEAWREPGRVDLASVEALADRVTGALADAAFPREASDALRSFAEPLAAVRSRVAQEDREASDRAALRESLAGTTDAREAAWTDLAERNTTDAGRLAADLLERAMRCERALAQTIAGAAGRPWAGVLRGALHVGPLPPGTRPVDAFAPGYDLWEPGSAWTASPPSVPGVDPADLEAWSVLRLSIPPASGGSLASRLATLGALPAVPADGDVPTAFWVRLRAAVAIALRPPSTPPEVPEGFAADPVFAAWSHAARPSRAAPGRGDSLATARAAFLKDDLVGAWHALEEALLRDPADPEAALLSSHVLERLAEPLPQRAVLLAALAEARRAWDLDATLATAPRQFADVALRLLPEAPPGLARRLEPVAERAARRALEAGQGRAALAKFVIDRLVSNGEARDALVLLRSSAALWPQDTELLLRLGRSEAEAGEPRKARKALLDAKRLLGADLPPWAETLLAKLGPE